MNVKNNLKELDINVCYNNKENKNNKEDLNLNKKVENNKLFQLESKKNELINQINVYKDKLTYTTNEREFYFGKLRIIEDLIDVKNIDYNVNQIRNIISKVLFSTSHEQLTLKENKLYVNNTLYNDNLNWDNQIDSPYKLIDNQ